MSLGNKGKEEKVLRLTRSGKIYYCAPSYSCPVHKQPRGAQPGDIQQHRDSLAIGSRTYLTCWPPMFLDMRLVRCWVRPELSVSLLSNWHGLQYQSCLHKLGWDQEGKPIA